MYQKVVFTIIRGIITFIFVMFLSRIMGRKLISQMTFFDFVVGITLGSLSANLAMGPENTTSTAATALGTLAVMAVITGFLDIKSLRFKKIVDSEPVTVIDNGTIVESNLKKIRLPITELNMKLREKNIFNLADVEFAILETDGQLSVLPKADKKPVTPSDMQIQTTTTGLMRDIIIDGEIMEENLKAADLDANWLQSELNKQGIQNFSEVLYAGIDNTKKLFLSKKNAGNNESHGKYGIE